MELTSANRMIRSNVRNFMIAFTHDELMIALRDCKGDVREQFVQELIDENKIETMELMFKKRMLIHNALIFLAQNDETQAKHCEFMGDGKENEETRAMKKCAQNYRDIAKQLL